MLRSKNQLKKVLAQTVKDYRKSHGLTQEKMAELLDITPRACSSMENEHSGCSGETLTTLLLLFSASEIQDILSAYREGAKQEQKEKEMRERQAEREAKRLK